MKFNFTKFLLFSALAVTLGASSCEKDPEPNTETGNVELGIQSTVGGDNLAIESTTYNADSAPEGFRLSRISFFLSDIRLVQIQDGRALETELSEVAYFNMGTSGFDSNVFENIPTGDYTSLRFNFGLTEEQDMTTPDEYAPTHPLGQTAEYWVDWGNYIFAKIEGKTDTIPDGQPRFEAPFVFHVGVAADNTRPGEIAINLPVSNGANELTLEFDVSTLMRLNQANELPLTEFDHGGRFAEQIVTSALSAFSAAE